MIEKSEEKAKAEAIPVVFTSGNHLTITHVLLAIKACQIIQDNQDKFKFEVNKAMISLAHDNYVKGKAESATIALNGKKYKRSWFNADERLAIAKATVEDAEGAKELFIRKDGVKTPITIEISDVELNHNCFEEHYDWLKELQEEAITKAAIEKVTPPFFILIGGADLANTMGNWSFRPGMPFLIADRLTEKSPTGGLSSHSNFAAPTAYLKGLGYEGEEFNKFESGTFNLKNKRYARISSTLIAGCDPDALNLMGPKSFKQLIDTFYQRCQPGSTHGLKEIETAKATLNYLATMNELDKDKKDIVQECLDLDPSIRNIIKTAADAPKSSLSSVYSFFFPDYDQPQGPTINYKNT